MVLVKIYLQNIKIIEVANSKPIDILQYLPIPDGNQIYKAKCFQKNGRGAYKTMHTKPYYVYKEEDHKIFLMVNHQKYFSLMLSGSSTIKVFLEPKFNILIHKIYLENQYVRAFVAKYLLSDEWILKKLELKGKGLECIKEINFPFVVLKFTCN
jgi:hypothetical protein